MRIESWVWKTFDLSQGAVSTGHVELSQEQPIPIAGGNELLAVVEIGTERCEALWWAVES